MWVLLIVSVQIWFLWCSRVRSASLGVKTSCFLADIMSLGKSRTSVFGPWELYASNQEVELNDLQGPFQFWNINSIYEFLFNVA